MTWRQLITLTDYCKEPRTMHECEEAGFTRDQVYAAVKRGQLVNQNRRDAWGRIRRGAGLFTVAEKPPAYDAHALVNAWGPACGTP
jgi:hypothetical protein